MERRLAAVLLTDMVGNSRLMGLDEEGTIARQRTHRDEIFDPKLSAHGGRIVKTTGDGLLVEFASAVDAVKCAIEVQQAMADLETDVAHDRRIQYRIGINLGDIVVDGDDILGDGVNVAARLEGLAKPGGICISGNVHDQLAGKVNIGFDDAGERTVKNVSRPVRVWQWETDQAERNSTNIDELPPLPDKPSIAVLPFQNLSGDNTQDYFVDDLVEDLTLSLGREKWLFVIDSPSTRMFKTEEPDIQQINFKLGVRYILRGSFRRSVDEVRIVVQLTDAITSQQVWSERFNDRIDDIFALQDRLAAKVVAMIAPALRSAEIVRAQRKRTKSLSAFDLYLQALPLIRASLSDNLRALELLSKAFALDPSYGAAHGLAARCYQFQQIMGWVSPSDPCLKVGVQHATKASDLGNDDSEALWMAGLALVHLDDNADHGLALIDRSLSLNSNSANAWMASCLARSYMADSDLAIDHFHKALRLNPLDISHHIQWNALCLSFISAGRYEDADRAADKTLSMLPTYPPGLRLKIAVCGHLGRRTEACRYVQRLISVNPECCVTWLSDYWGAFIRDPGFLARLIEGIRLGGLSEEPVRLNSSTG
jgi:class 3 adenylate cyclase/tetratricopeptide (TPR) repeat protein